MIEMKKKKNGNIVHVYNFSVSPEGKHSYATVWIPAERRWETLSVSAIVPLDCHIASDGDGCNSKTERNKIKEKLTLDKAIWVCSDGTSFLSLIENHHEGLNEAIKHEKGLLNE